MAALTSANESLSALEDRISVLEKISDFNIANPPLNADSNVEIMLRSYQIELLGKLKAIRAGLTAEGGDVGTIRVERDALKDENAALKKENERLNYRVRHLIKALNEEENAHSNA